MISLDTGIKFGDLVVFSQEKPIGKQPRSIIRICAHNKHKVIFKAVSNGQSGSDLKHKRELGLIFIGKLIERFVEEGLRAFEVLSELLGQLFFARFFEHSP